jgi:hypothetical protein
MADEPVVPQAGDSEQLWLSWESRVRILLNPSVWFGVLLAFGVSTCLFTALMLAISKSPWALAVGAGIFTFFMVIFLFVGLVIDLFGGFRVSFALTTLGVRSISGKGAKMAADAAFWTGVLAGSAGAMGAGLLAKSEAFVFIPYEEVSKVKLRPGRRYILVKGGTLQKPIGLYCTDENYPQAEAILRQQCTGAVIS